MAEVAGLTLGGISIASVFSSCVEILEYFEHGRNWVYDFSLALTKVNLMKVRLSQLGDHMQIERSLKENGVLQNSWPQGNSTVSDGLSGITKILGRTTELCGRYSHKTGAEPIKESGDCSIRALSSPTATTLSFTRLPPRPRVLSTLGKRVYWAVHDKKKFEGLISDFECILSNLERIVDGFENCQSPEQNSYSEKDYDCWPTDNSPMDKSKPPKKSKAEPRATTDERAPMIASSSTQRGRNQSSQPQMLGGPRAVGSCVSTWTNNHSCGQSVHLVGPQVGDEQAVERSRPGNYENNISFDQSYAITGPTDQATLETVTAAWLELAKYAVEKKQDRRHRSPE